MDKKRKKTPTDINQLTNFVVDHGTCDPACSILSGDATVKEKNPAVAALGRTGGLKGGKATKESAQKAAQKRRLRK
jgi:hypothetical protein